MSDTTGTTRSAARLALDGGEPVRSSFLPFHRPTITDADERLVVETLRSGWLTTGPRTRNFEAALAGYAGAARAVAVNSCTAALHLALDAVGAGPGDEVITTPMTFAATANVVCHVGASPVFVDVEPDTQNIDPALLAEAITERTKAIIVVDFAGLPPDLDPILETARARGVPVIEDAAHSIGAEYKGRRVGGLCDLTAFSFYATKNITSGEGGALLTNRDDWADRAQMMSLHGISRDAWKRYTAEGYRHWDIVAPGFKYNMFDLQAALVQSQFDRMEELWQQRAAITVRLRALLADVAEIGFLGTRSYAKHAWHLFPIIVRTERLTTDRDGFMAALQKEQIGVGVHFRAVHLHPYYRERFGFRPGMFPNAEYYSERTLSLPFFPSMTEQDIDDVAAAVKKVVAHYRRRST